ncbi:hypothetical protein SAMD00079811_00070 [Scytonema sp. HK-05]|nr:hypothetical protein SAMD00079811_00070 [Scytonema sp. HK-05]
MLSALLKKAPLPVRIENSWKLWKRLFPACVPPVILMVLPEGVTIELLGKVPSGVICARAECALKVFALAIATPNKQPQQPILDITPSAFYRFTLLLSKPQLVELVSC